MTAPPSSEAARVAEIADGLSRAQVRALLAAHQISGPGADYYVSGSDFEVLDEHYPDLVHWRSGRVLPLGRAVAAELRGR